MAKRKSAVSPKRARSSNKITAKAHGTRSVAVRSSKDPGKLLPSTAKVPLVLLPPHLNPQQPISAVVATAVSANPRPAAGPDNSKRGVALLSPIAIIRAFQTTLLEMVQANMQFSFELAQRAAKIRSPSEFICVNAEFTKTRMEMFLKHSKELTTF